MANLVRGGVFNYNKETNLVAFKSGDFKRAVIFIGGLTDGLLSLGYLNKWIARLLDEEWSFVQPILSSSYLGYGISSLQKDCEEIDALIDTLKRDFGISTVVLAGHSTGCQDSIYYISSPSIRNHNMVSGLILQGPVSDREYMISSQLQYKELQSLASERVKEGRGDELMNRSVDTAPMTYYRYHSLAGKMTDDDMFSSDLTDSELDIKFGGVKLPTLIVASLKDQYVPEGVDIAKMAARMSAAINRAKGSPTVCCIAEADHAFSNDMHKEEFYLATLSFLKTLL